jgi:excisionase family DNA binding protein
MSEQWLTVDEIAKELGVHPETVRVWIRKRELKAVAIRRTYRIRRSDYDEFIRQHEISDNTTSDTETSSGHYGKPS